MIYTLLVVLLIVYLIGGVPLGPRVGYGPYYGGGGVGLVILIVIILVLFGGLR